MLPLDNVMSMWFTAVPVFEWEPEPPPPPPDEGAVPAASDPCGADGAPTPEAPARRLVLKGYEWIPTPVWTYRENPAWEFVNGNRRDEDDERAELKAKPPAHVPSPEDLAAAQMPDATQAQRPLDEHEPPPHTDDWERP